MRPEQLPLFLEYRELRKDPVANAKRIDYLEGTLVTMNVGLIRIVAKEFPLVFRQLDDLHAIGCMAIVDALRDYDPERGQFSTHLRHQLRASASLQELERQVAGGVFYIPHNAWVEYKKALKEAKKAGTHLDLFDFECDKLNAIHNAITGQRGVEAGVDGDDLSLLDVLEQECFDCPSVSVHSSETMVAYREALATLDRRESFVIAEYYGLTGNDTKSLREIDLDGLSQEMINRIHKKALERMKKHHRLRELMSA